MKALWSVIAAVAFALALAGCPEKQVIRRKPPAAKKAPPKKKKKPPKKTHVVKPEHAGHEHPHAHPHEGSPHHHHPHPHPHLAGQGGHHHAF
jgi:hypothetical protein